MIDIEFQKFGKIPRLSRGCVITEKIDGTNACIYISEDGLMLTGSRNRWITPEDDNYGFSKWAHEHQEDLMRLGVGWHYGELWGCGIQRGYGIDHKVFSLFNSARWADNDAIPYCCEVVPVLYSGEFTSTAVDEALEKLKENGSVAVKGWDRPEGVVVYQTAGRCYFKKTIEKDAEWKGKGK